MNRREILAGAGVVLTSFAGCIGQTDEAKQSGTPEDTPTETPTPESGMDHELEGYIRPDEDPRTIPDELVCEDDEFERRSGWIAEDELQWGNLTDEDGNTIFALRVDALTVEPKEEIMVTLTNVSGREQETGNVHKANFDVYTETGWQDPRGWEDGQPKPITDDLWYWDPGESHELTFEMTERGIIEGDYSPHGDDLVTCPDLRPGRYRFATAAPQQGDVAIAFDLLE